MKETWTFETGDNAYNFEYREARLIHMYMGMLKEETQKMRDTVEDSPYHREGNVFEHTLMTIQEGVYNFAANYNLTPYEKDLVTTVLFFHDIGKPYMEEEFYSDRVGDYIRKYKGHEKRSARIWEDLVWENRSIFKEYFEETDLFYAIPFMIENHLPYNIKKDEKMEALVKSIDTGSFARETFGAILLGDAMGRIVDTDKKGIQEDSLKWVERFLNWEIQTGVSPYPSERNQTMYVLIGASGAGKSTLVKYMKQYRNDVVPYSLDWERVKFYAKDHSYNDYVTKETYANAFRYCNEHNDAFNSFADRNFDALLRNKDNIVLDNTNTTKKNRRRFINKAKQHGYRIQAVLFPTSLKSLERSHMMRLDKSVPWEVIENQYLKTSLPWFYEEVDNITFAHWDMEKVNMIENQTE